jgi:eukaryotic-like serine/threonine-protein kinase
MREKWIPKLQTMYVEDVDPGIHSALEWLLREWELRPDARVAGNGKGALKPSEDLNRRRWYVNRMGQTLMVVPSTKRFSSC